MDTKNYNYWKKELRRSGDEMVALRSAVKRFDQFSNTAKQPKPSMHSILSLVETRFRYMNVAWSLQLGNDYSNIEPAGSDIDVNLLKEWIMLMDPVAGQMICRKLDSEFGRGKELSA